ncbi:MAG: enoyl-CoA hydratase/isomerase family protein [Ectothiorhodospiraceae bacterium]|nr:enoyl-CoA hydratase/isomerase family protein [Chromatiales bacterium]MCP5156708.1 enoyl-CoA hydratase/isomerase family protein [Ectothiorhodospiraceae bacterium]
MIYVNIHVERHGRVALVRLNRPKVLNALNIELLRELRAALDALESDDTVGCIVLTGNERAFAAGADISEMAERTPAEMMVEEHLSGDAAKLGQRRKPLIAAVAGYALGGGCELAMMCDFIVAADNAKFGQPEIKLGVLPGFGGTQRLARAVGKARAMDMCLTARLMDAEEAVQAGLVSRVVPLDRLEAEVLEAATTIASMSLPATLLVKEAVDRAFETTLAEGCLHERRLFQAAFGLADQKEGMRAFLEKREPRWQHR